MNDDKHRVRSRVDALLAEEAEAGTDDALALAEAILAESDARESDRVDPPGQGVEHRRSEDTVELPAIRADREEPGDVARTTAQRE